MAKAWDLIPIRREVKKPATHSKKRSKRNCLFFVSVLAVFLISVVFFANANVAGFTLPKPVKSAAPTAKPAETKNAVPTLKIINGSGRFEETDRVSSLVKTAGVSVLATETAPNLYNQTTVYYKPAYKSEAEIIVATLGNINAKSQAFTRDSSYDLAVIIGAR